MRVGHYQCAGQAGDYEANIAKVLVGLRFAQERGVDVMTFPESFLTGYFSSEARTREHAFATDGPEIAAFLKRTVAFDATFMVGYNELRGGDVLNTVLVAHRGQMLGTYSKAFPCYEHFTPGREFPVFERDGVLFGVIICADGGYIEPTRILALKGARVVFAPHYNYVSPETVLTHAVRVQHDHMARAAENGVWFMRSNNVVFGRDAGIDRDGIGYGDSYLIDPLGRIVARSQLHTECFFTADIHLTDDEHRLRRSTLSGRSLLDSLKQALDACPYPAS